MTIDCYELTRKEIFLLEGIDYDQKNAEFVRDAAQKRLNINPIINSIPLITHQIYLTDKDNPSALDSYNFRKTVTSIILLNSVNNTWEHIFWTNNPDIIPQSFLTIPGVKIRLIDELKTSIIWDELQDIIAQAATDKAMFARASDFIRYAALNQFGGIYRDLDYEILKPKEFLKLAQAFHFFGGKEFSFEPVYVGSALVASVKNHPIIEGALEIIKRNSNPDKLELPEYLQYPCNKINQQIYETGPAVITMAFYKFANQAGYRDLLLPANILFNWDYARKLTPDSNCYQASLSIPSYNETIGYDLFCGAWHNNQGFFDRIFYNKANIITPKKITNNKSLPKAFNINCYHGLNKEIFAQENIDFDVRHQEISQDNLDKIAHPEKYGLNQKNPIPTISHHIYFTSSTNPVAIKELNLNKTISSINRLNEVNDNWQHFFWTNNLDIVPNSIRNLKNIEMHLVDELKNTSLWKQVNILLAKADINQRSLSGASNLVRYTALKIYGGVYFDLDYEIFSANKLYNLMQAYNFLGGKESDQEWSYMGNSFLASVPHHPILETAIAQIERNLNDDIASLPEYLQYPCTKFNERMYNTGPAMITLAFYKAANKAGNIDLLALPGNIFFNIPYIHYITPNTFCSKPDQAISLINNINGTLIETIGADMFCAPWPNSYIEPIFYPKNINDYLYYAAQIGDLNAIKDYLEYGANPNAASKLGFNPIYGALRNKQKEVAKFLITQGVELNIVQPNGNSPLDMAIKNQDPMIIQLLISAGANVTDVIIDQARNTNNKEIMAIIDPSLKNSSHSNIECYANHIDEIFIQEGFSYANQEQRLVEHYQNKIKELGNHIATNKNPIPFKTHQIYFTSKQNPQQLDNISKNKTITSLKRLNEVSNNWQHFIWTNSIENIPSEILTIPGVQVHLINKLKNSSLWSELQAILANAESNKFMFAQASDIVRLLVIAQEGGIYRDLDNEIYQVVELIKLIKAFQFVGGKEYQDEKSYIGNAFFASIPNHPVINTAIELIVRNANSDISSLPEYLQYPCNVGIKVIYNTGSTPLTTAYYASANQANNTDIVAPGKVFFNKQYARYLTPESRCHNPGYVIDSKITEAIAGDPFCGSWQSLEPIYYAKNKDSLLYQAASTGDLTLFNQALNGGADINKLHSNNVNPLSIAANKGHINIVKLLLDKGVDLEIPGSGYTPLYWAIQEGNLEIAKMLINAGANSNAKQSNGASILYLAVDRKLTNMVKSLLDAGADTNAMFSGRTAEMLAKANNYTDIGQIFLNNQLFRASHEGDYAKVVEALNLGAEIDSTHIYNATALYIAARRGHEKIAELLIKKGAQVDLPIASGDTALYVAASEGYTGIAKFLLDAGANKDIIIHNYSPLLVAAHFERVETVNLLLEYGVNLITDNSYTPFNVAQFKRERTEKGNIIYQNIVKHYINSLKPAPLAFEVVIARYNENLDWVIKEFPYDKITVYNKGLNDLKLPYNFQVIPLENTGREAHTYFHHIISNYNNLAERTLFIQGHPYEHPLFLPLARYKESLNSTCDNIIAKCSPAYPTLLEKANDLKDQLARNFKDLKVSYDLIEYTHKFIDPEYDPNLALNTVNGAQFAVEKQNILSHSVEYYQALKNTLINNINPVEGFYLERIWDIVFSTPKTILDPISIAPKAIANNPINLNKDLLQIVIKGSIQEANKLLNMGADANYKGPDGITPLYLASNIGNTAMTGLLLSKGADINVMTDKGVTALCIASANNHFATVALLVFMGADVNLTIKNSPLWIAVRQNNMEIVKFLVEAGAEIYSDKYMNPLVLALRLDHYEIHQYLLEQYQTKLKQDNINLPNCTSIPDDNKFEVVIVRYNEDVSWVTDEFPCHKVTIYNKGEDDLPPSMHYQEIKTPNVGYLGGTYLYHIAANYHHLADRTLFLQANPFDTYVFLPLARFQGELNSTCNNIIAKCEPGHNLALESIAMQKFDWKNELNGKYKDFNYQNNDLIKFAEQFNITAKTATYPICFGALFAIDKDIILRHEHDYYHNLSDAVNYDIHPIEDFYLERLWDLIFDRT